MNLRLLAVDNRRTKETSKQRHVDDRPWDQQDTVSGSNVAQRHARRESIRRDQQPYGESDGGIADADPAQFPMQIDTPG
jgi:hypothetical protein